MNRIVNLFQNKTEQDKEGLLNVYFTAGFPQLDDTLKVLKALQEGGADLVEIGMPYSDPVADGETIQKSNDQALENGMTVRILFDQLKDMRQTITVPVLLMGYVNPVLQFGIENFCKKCAEVGIDGLILPDMPMDVYQNEYKPIFDAYGILNIFLVTPQTSEKRIRQIDEISEGFIYTVSSASVTGSSTGVSDDMETYFNRLNAMNLKNPRLIGFGIKDNDTFLKASRYAAGAIIGSAFIRVLQNSNDLENDIKTFVSEVKGKPLEVALA
ncbi:tryptophan synthase subunit alpha [Dyadobacter psychrotolerans]|uniref:Tryptophan synthase alpha chain n=1 Tax=Dyadobacter psychrotolerans TaxID=2541721 RepID=A0A4R5D832_9BACT|nr:tryptophan synthase subunit alpha [Dyadobacter psychrotolerans]TDE08857.1 tryptophan synthase subunit alpha [Dyadobacter psychrotolerans]